MRPSIQTLAGGSKHLLMAHGFLGSPSEWEFLFSTLLPHYTLHLLTLPGHIEAPIDEDRDEFFIQLDNFVQTHSPMTLLGYSMGSRILMEVALRNLSSIDKIIVESGNPGIEDEKERAKRFESDCQAFKNIDFQLFLERWYRGPLFSHLNESVRNELILSKFTLHQPQQLAQAMRIFSPGQQKNLWPDIKKLNGHFIAGEWDHKYSQIGLRLANLGWGLDVVPDVGHNTHLEAPELFKQLVFQHTCP
ncbi:MAG: 2-succinyl-6-hydroxy-2,4-cyclohexadiene-1-carboxy late synthase [Bdellovibrio sp.]